MLNKLVTFRLIEGYLYSNMYRLFHKFKARFLYEASKDEKAKFIESFDTVITGCEGVIWSCGKHVEGASHVVNKLKNIGKRIIYLTNNSSQSRVELANKLQTFGFYGDVRDVITTSYLAALYFKLLPFKEKIYVIGSKAITEELDILGINYTCDLVNAPALSNFRSNDLHLDKDIGAVLLGYDKHFSYLKLTKAVNYLKWPDTYFVATCNDKWEMICPGIIYPGTGSLVSAIEKCTDKKVALVGKPSEFLLLILVKTYNVNPKRTLIIGDDIQTDIRFGTKYGFITLLVFTGICKMDELMQIKQSENEDYEQAIPDFCLHNIKDLMSLLL